MNIIPARGRKLPPETVGDGNIEKENEHNPRKGTETQLLFNSLMTSCFRK